MAQLNILLNREYNRSNWSPESIEADISNKVVLVTGGNAGLGYQTVSQLAKHSPKRIFLTARSKAKYDSAMEKICQQVPSANDFISFVEMDLASLASVKAAADKVLDNTNRLDILINNAGIMGAEVTLTVDGYENHFGTNHMGHALLTKLLLPLLLRTAEEESSDVRIIDVSSTAHMNTPSKGFDPALVKTDMRASIMMTRYGQSKLANILHAQELSKRYPTITSVSLHPGRVNTGLLDGMYSAGRERWYAYFQKFYDFVVGPMTEEKGAWNQLWCATIPKDKLKSGEYYVPVGYAVAPSKADEALAKDLWDWQESEFARLGYA